MLAALLAFALSAVVASAATSAFVDLAPRLGWVDLPGPRKIHRDPRPRIGGIPVLLGWASGLALGWLLSGRPWSVDVVRLHWPLIAPAVLVVFAIGVLDDVRGLSWRVKLAGQAAAALAVWLAGFRIDVLSHPLGEDPIRLGIWALPVTVLWIVGITNAMNLIDGLDGLAAGTALIATVAVAVIALHEGHRPVVLAAIALVGSLVGFLVFNFNPARIFLGDSGSTLLGFVLAVISIQGSQKGTTAVAVLAPLLLLGLPILDTSLTVARRLHRIGFRDDRNGEGRLAYVASNVHRVFLPDQGHIHHRLLHLGLSHRGAVLVLYSFVVLLAVAALAVVVMNNLAVAWLLMATLAILVTAFLTLLILRRNRWARDADDPEPAARSRSEGKASVSESAAEEP